MTKLVKTPTIKQQITFRNLLCAIEAGERFCMKGLMLESGYAPNTAINPGLNLTSKRGWQFLLSSISDEVILAKIYEVMLAEDKRTSLVAADILLKLKDRYPASKSKVVGLFQELKGLEEDEPDRNTEGSGQGI